MLTDYLAIFLIICYDKVMKKTTMTLQQWIDSKGLKKHYVASHVLMCSYPTMFRILKTGKASKTMAQKIYDATDGQVDLR